MLDFTFCSPTSFTLGRGVENKIGEEAKRFGAKKALLHFGGQSAEKSGLLGRVRASLKAAGVEFVEVGGVQPNPRLELVQSTIELVRREGIDFILAVGGGSVIDSAKAISVGVGYEGDVWDFYIGKTPPPAKAMPLGVVLTIPAAGSEGSNSSVITWWDKGLKRGLGCEAYRPTFALLNPELTYTLPPFQTACGVVDMMAHIMERYFTNTREVDLTDRLCESLLRTIIAAGTRAMTNPEDYDARADLMWASTLAHNNLLGSGREGDWASHQLEHELSAKYDVAHGAGLATVFPAWMKYVYKHDAARFAQFANRVFDIEINPFDLEATALKGIEALKAYFGSIGMPLNFEQLGAKAEDIPHMAKNTKCNADGFTGMFVKLYEKERAEIYKLMV